MFSHIQIREGECQLISRPFAVVLSPVGIFVVAKKVSSLTNSLLYSLSGQVPQLLHPADMWGFPLMLTDTCPDMVFMLPAVQDTPLAQVIDQITWVETESGWELKATDDQLHSYVHFCRCVGVLALVESVGWQMVLVPPCADTGRNGVWPFGPYRLRPACPRFSSDPFALHQSPRPYFHLRFQTAKHYKWR